jgi:hypothetical protein
MNQNPGSFRETRKTNIALMMFACMKRRGEQVVWRKTDRTRPKIGSFGKIHQPFDPAPLFYNTKSTKRTQPPANCMQRPEVLWKTAPALDATTPYLFNNCFALLAVHRDRTDWIRFEVLTQLLSFEASMDMG